MYQIKNFQDNDDVRTVDQLGPFTVIEYLRDLSVTPGSAMTAYYCNEMNVRKRQVLCDLGRADITIQAGAMQWMVGDVKATTGVKGVGDQAGIHRQRHLGAGADLQTFNFDGCRRMEWFCRSGRWFVLSLRFPPAA